MKASRSGLLDLRTTLTAIALAAAGLLANSAAGQLVAYDDAGNYVVSANWTNGANQGFGFTPWVIVTNGPDSHGTYINSANNPTFVIASVTNVLGTNYTDIFGVYANGPTDINETTAYRGFVDPLGTNTFKLQWGSRGAGVTTTANSGQVHGWCGFTLRNGNVTNTTADFQNGVRFYLYFLDGAAPSTIYVWDGFGVQSIPGTSFSDLGRGNITNALQAEITVAADGNTYHLVLKDCVVNRTIYTLDSMLMGSGTVDSVALFCHETTGDQIYNRMQIAVPRIPPTIVNVQPPNGSIYLDPVTTTPLFFEVDSFNSTVATNAIAVYLNGALQPNVTYNLPGPASQLLGTCAADIAPDTFYNYVITAQDANGDAATNNFTFNTFLATDLYIDAYDYNYDDGQFIDSPTPSNAYAGLFGTNGIDYLISDTTGVNNTAGYRPGDLPQMLSLNADATGDAIDHANLRANGHTTYNIGFTDTGNWENYTRTIPTATNYSIYARAASAAGGQFEIEELVNPTATSSNQPLAALGRVNVPPTGGSKVFTGQLTPLTDLFGNTVIVPLSGTKTLRTTAISSRGYNLEYLVVVAVTNAADTTLRPYLATANPAPNATGVGLAGQISFNIANRQTAVTPSSIKLFVNTSNVTSGLVLSNNALGSLGTYTLSTNLPANATNTIVVTFSDGALNFTNSWSFITASSGGITGSGLWSAGGGTNLNWSTAANWTGGTPGPGNSATFASVGSTNLLAVDNIVATNVTIAQLNYATNNNGYRTTMIADGVTLTITNGGTAVTAAIQVGVDNTFNKPVTNTITGANGTLLVSGNPPGSGLANQLNFQVRQNATPAAPEQTVLDMSGLGTLVATVGKFYVAQGGTGTGQNNVSGRVNMARTNVVTCLRPNAGQFEVGDSSGAATTLPGSTLNLGITNAFFVDTTRFGKQKATNNLVRFNPVFTNGLTPSTLIRGTNGLSSRVATWTIADADTESTTPEYVDATVDFSGGRLDAMVNNMIIGRGATTSTDTGYALGTLTIPGGTLDVINLQIGVQRAVNAATETGIVTLNGPATLVCSNVTLAQMFAGGLASEVTGTINANGGTVQAITITAGGGVSALNLDGGVLKVTGSAGTLAAPLSALNLTGSSLHLRADGANSAAVVNATAVSASGTTITIDAVTNITSSTNIHLITYTGTDPYAGLSLAPLPAGYAGTLVDNAGSIDLHVTLVAPPPPPSIRGFALSGGNAILGGTNNSATGGGTYRVLTSTNVALALTNWTLLTNGSFDANGRFSSTNPASGTRRFYILQVP